MSTRCCVLLAAVVFATTPAWAGAVDGRDDAPVLGPFDLDKAKATFQQLVERGLAVIENHLEVKGGLQAGAENGEQSGRLSFKVFPNGKAHAEDSIGGETSFRFTRERGLHFEFNFVPDPQKPGLNPTSLPGDVI